MKKFLIILLFIIFAIPFSPAILCFLITFTWLFKALLYGWSAIQILVALFGTVVSATYPVTYIFALVKTWKNNKITAKTFLPVVHCLVAYIFLLLVLGPAH